MVDDYKKRYERSLNQIEKYEDNYTIEDNNNNDVEAVEVKESINQTNNSYESEEFIEDWPQLEVSEKSENIKTKFNNKNLLKEKELVFGQFFYSLIVSEINSYIFEASSFLIEGLRDITFTWISFLPN
jgi:hypothetical protein